MTEGAQTCAAAWGERAGPLVAAAATKRSHTAGIHVTNASEGRRGPRNEENNLTFLPCNKERCKINKAAIKRTLDLLLKELK